MITVFRNDYIEADMTTQAQQVFTKLVALFRGQLREMFVNSPTE